MAKGKPPIKTPNTPIPPPPALGMNFYLQLLRKPKKFETPEEMQEVIDDYFKSLANSEGLLTRPPTVSGLAFTLNMSTASLLNYQKREGYEPYFAIVTRAKQICELFLEERGLTDNNRNVMSLLSMNFGRTEVKKVEVEDKTDFAAQLNRAKSRLKSDENEPK